MGKFFGTHRSARKTRHSRPSQHALARFRFDLLESRQLLATLTVTTTADSGSGSLRDAISMVNSGTLSGTTTIDFAIGSGVQSIAPMSALPTIMAPVILDGTAPPALPTQIIQLTGGQAGVFANGLTISAGNSTVSGLVINGFGGFGIEIDFNGGNLITGNFIGTDTTGTLAEFPNGESGILVFDAPNNTIGGAGLDRRLDTCRLQRNIGEWPKRSFSLWPSGDWKPRFGKQHRYRRKRRDFAWQWLSRYFARRCKRHDDRRDDRRGWKHHLWQREGWRLDDRDPAHLE